MVADGEVASGSEGPVSGRMTRRRFVQYGAGLAAVAGLDLSGARAAFAQGPGPGPSGGQGPGPGPSGGQGPGPGPSGGQGPGPGPSGGPIALFDMQYLWEMDLSDPAQAASAYDQMQLVAALQGIVNREAPRLYVNFSGPNSFYDGYPDEYWLAQLQGPGAMLAGQAMVPVADLDSLIRMFRPFLRGSVIWDPKVWSTANVATTVAGVEDVVPIRYDPSPGSLYSRYVAPTVAPGTPPAPPSGQVPPGTPPALPPGPPPALPPAAHVPPERSLAPPPGHAPLGPPPVVAPGYIAYRHVPPGTPPPAPPGPPPGAGDRLPAMVWLVGRDGASLFTGSGVIPGVDLASSGSAKCDAYLWAKVKYLDTRRCDPSQLGYYLDAYWLVDPSVGGLAATCVTNHDYLVSKRGFLFDLSPWAGEEPPDSPHEPLGTDVKTLQAILLSAYQGTGGRMTVINGFVPWQYKYTNLSEPVAGPNGAVAAEWECVEIISAYNAYLDADAPGIGNMANASVFAHVALQGNYPQPSGPTVAELQKRGLVNADGSVVPKRYVMFYLGDFDSAAWMYNTLPGLWNDPGRGAMPLNWAFDPELSNRIAPAFLYTRATATGNDFFIAGDSGAGYLNPSALEAPRAISGLPSGLAAWQRHCGRYYGLWDISITGFVIDGNTPAMSSKGRQAYAQFSYNGFAEMDAAELGIVGTTPYLQMPSGVGGTPAEAAGQIEAMLYGDTSGAPYVPEWHSIRATLMTPTWYEQVAGQLQSDVPDADVVFLDAFTFYALIRQYLEDQVIASVSVPYIAAVTGESVPVTVDLVSYASTATVGTVALAVPTGWKVSPSSAPFELPGGSSGTVTLGLEAPVGAQLGQSQEVWAVVTVAGQSRRYGFETITFSPAVGTAAVSIVLGATNLDSGISMVTSGDGVTKAVTVDGESARETVEVYPNDLNIYFALQPGIAFDGDFQVAFTVDYFDTGTNTWLVQYDSNNTSAPVDGAYATALQVTNGNTGQWKTVSATVNNARFDNRENSGADFRIASNSTVTIHSVSLVITGPGVRPL